MIALDDEVSEAAQGLCTLIETCQRSQRFIAQALGFRAGAFEAEQAHEGGLIRSKIGARVFAEAGKITSHVQDVIPDLEGET
jgi:hypothetical protein